MRLHSPLLRRTRSIIRLHSGAQERKESLLLKSTSLLVVRGGGGFDIESQNLDKGGDFDNEFSAVEVILVFVFVRNCLAHTVAYLPSWETRSFNELFYCPLPGSIPLPAISPLIFQIIQRNTPRAQGMYSAYVHSSNYLLNQPCDLG